MTRGKLARVRALEARRGHGAALEVWTEDTDAPGFFRQTFPTSSKGGPLRREEVEARKVARLIFVEYVDMTGGQL